LPDLSPINMKQNKVKPYQVCFLSTGDFVNKGKDRIKRDTLISGNDSVDLQIHVTCYLTEQKILDMIYMYIHKLNYKIGRV
jgi:hypothetical protein